MATTELLRCQELVVGHGGRALLPPVTVSFGSGELWLVTGQNGSGKTTWLRTVLGLLTPVSGSVELCQPGLRRCYLSQRQSFDPHYPLTVEDVVAMGLEGNGAHASRAQRRARVARALELTSVLELSRSRFHQLSEGQKQRVLLARVHASGADLAVLDEPTSALDGDAERQAWEQLKRLQGTGMTLVVVTHALELAAEYAGRALCFDRDTRSVRVEPADSLRTAPRGSSS
jgi:zinc transport system ATP-binding protein